VLALAASVPLMIPHVPGETVDLHLPDRGISGAGDHPAAGGIFGLTTFRPTSGAVCW
jgi:hypothetical protein